MHKLRILLVDDSVLVRRLVGELLAGDPAVESVATAATGRIAMNKLARERPDLVIVNPDMSESEGLQTLETLRAEHPSLPVLQFGRESTGEPILDGPEALRQVGGRLLERMRSLFPRTRARPTFIRPEIRRPAGRIDAVVVGVSTGGPNALSIVLAALPEDLPVPVFIVQHMPPVFTRVLAQRLDSQCALPVVEAEQDMPVVPGRVVVCPGDHHLELPIFLGNASLRLTQGPPENSCRPSVDVLFRSATEAYRGATLGVVLTGMGKDGCEGCRLIREAGGQVIVQDEASSVVWGMPGAVSRAGLADAVLGIDAIGQAIVGRVARGRSKTHSG